MGLFQDDVLEKITFFESFKLHFYGFLWSLWHLFINLAKHFLRRNKDEGVIRRSPPTCLTDTSLGQHSYIKLKKVKLHYVKAGDKKNPLVILLHGFPDCWITWRYQIPELSKFFRVIALDLKGFGDSDKPMWRHSYSVPVLVKEIVDLIQALGYRSAGIIGHDLGALIAWFVAATYPDIVTKLVLLAAPHPNLYWDSPNTNIFNKRWIQFCQTPLLAEFDAMKKDLELLESCYKHLTSNATSQSYLEAYKYVFSRREDWTGAMNYYRNLPFWRLSLKNRISIPCLLAVGNKDVNVYLENVVKSSELLDKFTLKVVDGTSHYLHQERPSQVNTILINFLVGGTLVKKEVENDSNGGLVNRMFGAMSSTVKYGNSVFDVVQKKTNVLSTKALFGQSGV